MSPSTRQSIVTVGLGPRIGLALGVNLSLLLLGPALFAASKETQKVTSFDSDGTRIHYRVDGPAGGEPVLLIHGYRATGSLNWSATIDHLADRYRVITIDNRGHGKSDKPENPEAYGREMVRDQVRLLDHLGIESAHVAGYSMGGMIALRMAVDHPERVRSAAITGMGWTRDDEGTKQRFARPRDEDRAPTNPAYRAAYVKFGDLGISKEQLRAIQVPMITIVGSADGLYQSSVQPLREVRPDVPLVLIDGASHMTAPMKPEFRDALARWIDEQQSSSSSGAAAQSTPQR